MKPSFSPKVLFLLVSTLVLLCIGIMGFLLFVITNSGIETGGYSIEEVLVSNNPDDTLVSLDELVFHPSDTVYCTVITNGVDGIIGMRWFFGDEVISNVISRTTNNRISTYIAHSSPDGLPVGRYHIEIFVVEDEPIETIYFDVAK